MTKRFSAEQQASSSQIIVSQPEPQVSVEQQAPEVAVSQPQPQVDVNQPQSQRSSFRQAQLTVTVEMPQARGHDRSSPSLKSSSACRTRRLL